MLVQLERIPAVPHLPEQDAESEENLHPEQLHHRLRRYSHGDAVIERDVTLLPLSLVLKEMILPTGAYEGSHVGSRSGSILIPPLAPP